MTFVVVFDAIADLAYLTRLKNLIYSSMAKTKNMLDGVDLKSLIDWLKENGGDGWTIWKTSAFTSMGFDKSILPIREIESDTSSPKSTIYDRDGKVIPKVKGVYGLSFLRRLANELGEGSAGSMFFGRGSEARAITAAILPKLESRLSGLAKS